MHSVAMHQREMQDTSHQHAPLQPSPRQKRGGTARAIAHTLTRATGDQLPTRPKSTKVQRASSAALQRLNGSNSGMTCLTTHTHAHAPKHPNNTWDKKANVLTIWESYTQMTATYTQWRNSRETYNAVYRMA